MYTLHIGNKNYSSWSLRPWVLMTALGIPFKEEIHWLYVDDFSLFSPTGTVPCLQEGEIKIWDSLAIMEYLAETYEEVWPHDKAARAWARSASAEMHSGFAALRNDCSMHCSIRVELNAISPQLQRNVDRINELWEEGLTKFGGPFLAGEKFGAVDALFSAVVFRFQTYNLPMSEKARQYFDTMLKVPAMRRWYKDGLAETVKIPQYEALVQSIGKITKDFRTP